jgi:hypothetical protein
LPPTASVVQQWPVRHAEVDGLGVGPFDLGEFVVGAGEADTEPFDLAEPSFGSRRMRVAWGGAALTAQRRGARMPVRCAARQHHPPPSW